MPGWNICLNPDKGDMAAASSVRMAISVLRVWLVPG
jgi:hypothetical protein